MYTIEKWDGLYCVFKHERLGFRIVCAFETLKEAKEYVAQARR